MIEFAQSAAPSSPMVSLVLSLVAVTGSLGAGYMVLRGVRSTNETKVKSEGAAARAAEHAAEVQEKNAAMDAVLAVAQQWRDYAMNQQEVFRSELARMNGDLDELREEVEEQRIRIEAARRAEERCQRDLATANRRLAALGG